MKGYILFIFLISGIFYALWSNPIDNTPKTDFSELVFDDHDDWMMEILFPFGYRASDFDSIILQVSATKARLKTNFPEETRISVINAASLSIPLTINRNGDSLTIYTYSSTNPGLVRVDGLIFGNGSNASVGPPKSGYSIMRNSWVAYDNRITIDCLTKNPSLGVANDTVGLSCTLKGYLYDLYHQPVTRLLDLYGSICYFQLHAPLYLDQAGAYRTQVFRRFTSERIDHLSVRLPDFGSWMDSVAIEPFALTEAHPDTTLIQDIQLRDNKYVVTEVIENDPLQPGKFSLVNYPNPFSLATHFWIKIPGQFMGKTANIGIYNASGQVVKNIPIKPEVAVQWNGTADDGSILPSGIYYYRFELDKEIIKTGSMILLR